MKIRLFGTKLVLVLQNMEETELLKEKEDETNTFGLENWLATFVLFIQKLVFCVKYMNQFFGYNALLLL
jgi:hypothetical protein